MTPQVFGYVSQVYNGSAVDGPGLRCVVFLSGCNLRCPFCHNPETFDIDSGTRMSAEDTAARVLRYRTYIKNGGVTFSGGEPFLQPDYVQKTIKLLHAEGIHCAVQTNATLMHIGLIEAADLIIADIKNFDAPPDARALEFLRECRRQKKSVWLTNVIITGINDTAAHLSDIKRIEQELHNVQRVDFLPFKKYCTEKYQRLGMAFPYADRAETSSADIKRVQQLYAKL